MTGLKLLTRRTALAAMAPGVISPRTYVQRALAETNLIAESKDRLEDFLPFRSNRLRNQARKVLAHWHVFPISVDNRAPAEDYYTQEWLKPKNLQKGPRDFGAFMRERPLPRPPRRSPQWIVEDMEQDIRWAAAIGIDGFLFNIVDLQPSSLYWRYFRAMLDAAPRVSPDFHVVPNLDVSILKDRSIVAVADAVQSFAANPALLRSFSGDLLLGAFMAEQWPAGKWRDLFNLLGDRDISVSFVPTFLNTRNATPEHLELATAVGEWGGNFVEGAANMEGVAAAVRRSGKQWIAPVWPQDYRPKDGVYGEAQNSRLFRDGWVSAIKTQAEFVQLITWNDYSEASEIRPSTGIQFSFYDLAAYYIEWFKSGRQPEIMKDVLYYFHRVETTTPSTTVTSQATPMTLLWGRRPFNDIEVVAFLTAPGQLDIEIDGERHSTSVRNGMTTIRVPLANGRPSFRLTRDNRTIIAFSSAFAIRDPGPYQDLLYRGGSSTRPPAGAASE